MAERTITSVNVNARAVYKSGKGAGVQAGLLHVCYDHYNFAHNGETVSPSLVIQMCPLPDQARILNITIRTDFGGTGGFVVGDASLSNRFFTGQSLSAAPQIANMISTGAAPSGGLNYKVSLTASDVNSFYPLLFELNGAPTASASGCVAMTVYYTIDVAAT